MKIDVSLFHFLTPNKTDLDKNLPKVSYSQKKSFSPLAMGAWVWVLFYISSKLTDNVIITKKVENG